MDLGGVPRGAGSRVEAGRGSTLTVMSRDLKKRIRLLCPWDGEKKRLGDRSISLQLAQGLALSLFLSREERTLLINLDRKEFAAYEPF